MNNASSTANSIWPASHPKSRASIPFEDSEIVSLDAPASGVGWVFLSEEYSVEWSAPNTRFSEWLSSTTDRTSDAHWILVDQRPYLSNFVAQVTRQTGAITASLGGVVSREEHFQSELAERIDCSGDVLRTFSFAVLRNLSLVASELSKIHKFGRPRLEIVSESEGESRAVQLICAYLGSDEDEYFSLLDQLDQIQVSLLPADEWVAVISEWP